MRTIKRISSSGWRAQEFDEPTSRKMAFLGPNGAGKSTRLEIPDVALLGPRDGRSIQALKNVSPAFTVTAELDGGLTVTRTIDGEHSIHIAPAGKGKLTLAKAQERIIEETGLAPLYIDLSSLLSKTESELREKLLGLCPEPRERTKDEVSALLSECKADVSEAALAHVEEAIAEVLGCWKSGPVLDAIQALLTDKERGLGVQYTYWNKIKRSSAEAGQAIAQAKNEDEAASLATGNIEGLAREIADLQAQLEATAGEAAEYASREREANRLKNEIEECERLMAADIQEDPEPRIAEIEQELQGIDLASAETEIQGLRERIANETAQIDSLKDRAHRIKGGRCELIGQACPALADPDARKKIQTEMEGEYKRRKEIQRVAQERKQTLETIFRTNAQRRRDLENERARLQKAAISRAKELERRRGAEDRLAKARAAQAAMPPTLAAPAEDPQAIRTVIRERQGQRDAKIRAGEAARLQWREIQKAKVAEEVLRAVKAMQAALGPQGLLGAILAESIGPLIDAANEVMQTIRPERIEARLVDQTSLGWNRDGVFIDWRNLSSGEKLIFTASVVAGAVAMLKPALPILLIDDFEKIHPDQRPDVLKALDGLSERFGNIWIAAAVDNLPLPEGWEARMVGKAVAQ